jgi:hypothetical protein
MGLCPASSNGAESEPLSPPPGDAASPKRALAELLFGVPIDEERRGSCDEGLGFRVER